MATSALSLLVALALAGSVGCDPDPGYPWENTVAPPPANSGAPLPAPSGSEAAAPPDPTLGPRGGLFARCLEGLGAERDPVVDVARLVTVCGASTGMERAREAALEGALAEAGPPMVFELPLAGGRCYRLFAVGGPGILELEVEVRSSRDTVVASDHRSGRVAVVQPDRPFCALADDAATIVVRSPAGSGAFALDIVTMSAANIDGPRQAQ